MTSLESPRPGSADGSVTATRGWRPACLRVPIDAETTSAAVDLALSPGSVRTLFTMNLDHAAVMESRPDFAAAYGRASVRVVDGWPVSVLHWAFDRRFPRRVPGADLFGDVVAEAWRRQVGVFLLGSTPERLRAASARMRSRWPGVTIAGQLSPPNMHLVDDVRDGAILDAIDGSHASVVFVLFGAPTSELWLDRNRHRLPVASYLCLGAAADFFGGTTARAPVLVARFGLEWLWRMLHEPRRLARRYLLRDLPFFVRSLAGALVSAGRTVRG